jgi:formate-dependent nitrite reductase cytochrome c552 subunit
MTDTGIMMLSIADGIDKLLETKPDAAAVPCLLAPDIARKIASTLRECYSVGKWATTDMERTVNGILCADADRCSHCDFRCAKWDGKGYDAAKQVKRIREILDRWEAAKDGPRKV